MRQGPNTKRPRGRGNGRKHGTPRVHTYESNGPDVKVRGNAHQVLEKYLALARDASTAGDRIGAEGYYQHAEHYYRLLNANSQANANGARQPGPGNGHAADESGDGDSDELETVGGAGSEAGIDADARDDGSEGPQPASA